MRGVVHVLSRAKDHEFESQSPLEKTELLNFLYGTEKRLQLSHNNQKNT